MRGAWWTGAIIGLAIATAPAGALELRMLTSWDAVPLLAEGFAKNVEKASNGNIKFVLNGPRRFRRSSSCSRSPPGVPDAGTTHGVYHFGLYSGISMGLDALGGTMAERHATGVFDVIDKHYQKLGPGGRGIAINARTDTPSCSTGRPRRRRPRWGTPSYHADPRARRRAESC